MSFLKTNNAEIYYEVVGKGKPLIILNGLMATADLWKQTIVAELTKDFKCILTNFRGQALTKVNSGFVFTDILDDINSLANEVSNGSPVNILGDGFGASIALSFATKYADKINKIAVSGAAGARDYNLRLKMQFWHTLLKKTDVSTLAQAIFPDLYSNEYLNLNTSYIDKYLKSFIKSTKDFKKENMLKLLKAVLGNDIIYDYSKIKNTVLVIQGKHDLVIPMLHGQALKSYIPNNEYIELETGHALMTECPKVYINVIKEFFLK